MQDAVGVHVNLGHLVADQKDRKALFGELAHNAEDARARADIDADGRAVEEQDLRRGREPFRQDDPLLVAAREGADRIGRLADLDRQLGDPVADGVVLPARREEPARSR